MKNRLEFIGIEVSYPPPEVCCYPEYKGKPYFAIKYKEDGKYIVGFGTYNQEVLSRYIKEYFIPTIAVSPWRRVEDDPPDGKADAIFDYEWTGISGTIYRETSIISLNELIALGCRPIAWMEKPEPPKEDA